VVILFSRLTLELENGEMEVSGRCIAHAGDIKETLFKGLVLGEQSSPGRKSPLQVTPSLV